MKMLLSLCAALLLAAPVARADDEPAKADAPAADKAADKPAEAAPAEKAEAAPAKKGGGDKGGDDHAYVDTAVTFLKALAHSSRKGDQGEKAWADLKETAGDKIALKIAGADHDIDVAGKKSDVRLLKFQKISSWREGKEVKGVLVDVLQFKVGKEEHTGKGKVSMAEKDGKWTVTSVETE
jgi:hypothetical protein